MIRNYVYSIEAVRAAIKRGRTRVWLFWPGGGHLVCCTPRNIDRIAKQFRNKERELAANLPALNSPPY